MREHLIEYLQELDFEGLRDIVNTINWWNGALDWLDYDENDETFYDIYFRDINNNPMELARAIYFGDYNYNDEYIHFNAYGNLETCNEFELEKEYKDYIEEIADALIEEEAHIEENLNEDIRNILREAEKE